MQISVSRTMKRLSILLPALLLVGCFDVAQTSDFDDSQSLRTPDKPSSAEPITNDLELSETRTEPKPEATEALKKMESTNKYTKVQLARPGFLREHFALPLRSDPERAIFVGVYDKKYFDSIESFITFTANISSITQDWYTDGNLDKAYKYYYPPQEDDPA